MGVGLPSMLLRLEKAAAHMRRVYRGQREHEGSFRGYPKTRGGALFFA